MASGSKTKGGLQTKQVVLILGIVLILAAAAVTIYLLTRDDEEPAVEAMDTNSYLMDPDNIAGIQEDIRAKVEKGMFRTHMNTIWTFPDAESPSSDAIMANSAANNYPFWFEVLLDGEQIFKSSLIPLGSQIKEIKLTKDLEPGQYDAVISLHMVDENDQEVESNMGFNVTLVIES